jgi:hypothetical protein
MSMGRNFNFTVCCLNQFLLVRSGRIMSDWELGGQVRLFIDGEISGSGSLVSTPSIKSTMVEEPGRCAW